MMALMSPKVWVALAFAGLLAIIGLQQVRVSNAKAQTAQARADLASDRTTYAQAAQIAEQSARAEETRRNEATRKVVSDAHIETAAAKDAAGAAERAAVELRRQLARYVAASRGAASNPPASSGGAPTSDSIGLLGRLFTESDDRSAEMARYADAARIAGIACEKSYDSLTVK